MKKLFTFLFCLVFLVSGMTVASAETIIKGLNECYENVWIDINDDSYVIDTMKRTNDEYAQKEWLRFSTAPEYMKKRYGYTGTIEEQKEKYLSTWEHNYDDAYLVYYFESMDYLLQFASEKICEYLVCAHNFWAVPYKNDNDKSDLFKSNGEVITYYDNVYFPNSYILDKEELAYLKDLDSISDTLKEYGISSVDDMKVVVVDWGCTALYVKSDSKEYMIRMHDYGLIPEFEKYKVYTASEAIKLVSESTGRYNKTKVTFEEEALSLQSEGLLNGTDKGLDLLKPLTRIETATMLLRAMGEEALQEENVQTFADVSNTHWGYGAAEKAYSLGLIRGVGDNLFAPDGRVTKEQFATMVLRAGNYGEFNWEEAFDILVAEGIISAEEAQTMDFFTRGDMAKIIFEAKNKGFIE